MYFALSTIKHNGNRYFRGDQLPEIAEAQLAALVQSGAVSAAKPDQPAQEETEEPAQEPVAELEQPAEAQEEAEDKPTRGRRKN